MLMTSSFLLYFWSSSNDGQVASAFPPKAYIGMPKNAVIRIAKLDLKVLLDRSEIYSCSFSPAYLPIYLEFLCVALAELGYIWI